MPLPLAVEDICHLDAEAQNRCMDAWIRDDRQRPFARGETAEALARLHIFLRSPETFEFCMSMHHAIIDGWSYVAFLQQLTLSKKSKCWQCAQWNICIVGPFTRGREGLGSTRSGGHGALAQAALDARLGAAPRGQPLVCLHSPRLLTAA
jgi:hypothetical protein